MAAWVIARKKKSDHITPILEDLHWLPVDLRIDFKVLCYVFKCQNDLAPSYLADLIKTYVPRRALRPTRECKLIETRQKNSTYSGRAFSSAAPTLWNQLPSSIRSQKTIGAFKKHLKTYFYCKHFNSGDFSSV